MASNAGSLLDRHIDDLTGFLSEFNPGDVPLSEITDLYAKAVRHENLASAIRVKLLARVKESNVASKAGQSTAEWVANQTGDSVGKARADLETSERLAASPLTDQEMCDGGLSAAQAAAITGANNVNPGSEADLIETARKDSLKELKAEAERRKAERDRDAEAARERAYKARSARHWTNGATGHLHIQGPAAAVAEMAHGLNLDVNERYRHPAAKSEREPREAYMFDAAHARLTGRDDGKQSTSIRRQMLIRVDLAALVRGELADGEVCEIAGIGPISVAEARELMGDSNLRLVLTKGVAVGNVVHLGRGPTVAEKIAKLWERHDCIVEGCNRSARIEYDHRIPWVDVLKTEVDNLDKYCKRCHDQKTHHDYALIPGTGRRPLVAPDDPRHPNNQPATLFDTG